VARRPTGTIRAVVPRISDGVICRVLTNLLILDGERLSYRTLDVEQIGSVYETMMGFDLKVAQGRSIALKPKKPHGAPSTINLEALLDVKAADRAKWLKENADQEVTGQVLDALKNAASLDELLAALEKKIAKTVTIARLIRCLKKFPTLLILLMQLHVELIHIFLCLVY
jgi:hypothetical protein